MKASNDQVVRPAAIGIRVRSFIIANNQIATPDTIAIVVGRTRAADDMDVGTCKSDVWPYDAFVRIGDDIDKITKLERLIFLNR